MSADQPVREMEPELLPCPFCGGQNLTLRSLTMDHTARCLNCAAFGPVGFDDDAATERWNRRAAASTPPEPVKETEPLDSQIERLAHFIIAEVPGEPSQSEGAVDTAIRIIRTLRAAASTPSATQNAELERDSAELRALWDAVRDRRVVTNYDWRPETFDILVKVLAAAPASSSPTEEERSERRREYFAGFNAGYNTGIATEKGKSLVLPPDVTDRYCANCGMFNLSCRSISHFDGRPCCDKCTHGPTSYAPSSSPITPTVEGER